MRLNGYTSRKKKKNKMASTVKNLFFIFSLIIFIGIAAFIGFVIGVYLDDTKTIQNISEIEAPDATIIYASNKDENGENIVLDRIYKENRTHVELSVIPEELINATIAVEDKRFYQHSGIDLRGMSRAFLTNLKSQSLAQGGSTITMQLARNLKLGFAQEKTINRKLQELLVAIQIEKQMSKDEILEAYLNRIYYGNRAFGVQAASKTLFNKNVQDLSLAQSAYIAGLPKAPSFYTAHYKEGILRKDVVLQLMLEQHFISQEEYENAKNETLVIQHNELNHKHSEYHRFINCVIKELSNKFSEDEIYNGGLRVYTTLDTRLQDIADKSFNNLKAMKKSRLPKLEACFVAVQPDNGFIRAMVGSLNPENDFNIPTQGKRQSGSIFKVVVYATAMEKLGWTPYTRISNERYISKDRKWRPKNANNRYGGTVTLRNAVAQSINMAAIRAAEKVGMTNVAAMAKRLGMNTPIEPYLSSAIGGMSGVTPLEMLSPFSVICNNGIINKTTFIYRVYDRDKKNILIDNTPSNRKTKVLGKDVCDNMDSVLRSVITSGTGRNASSIRDARGKTGTNGKSDIWFAGYVPKKLSAIVWIGNDDNSKIPSYFSGGGQCAPIWRTFMNNASSIIDEVINETKVNKKNTDSTIDDDKSTTKRREYKRYDDSTNAPPVQDAPLVEENIPEESPSDTPETKTTPEPNPEPISHEDVTADL